MKRCLLVFAFLLCLPFGAFAEDVNVTLAWIHSGRNVSGDLVTIDFIAGWGTTPGPPYANLIPVNGNRRSVFIPFTALTPGDTLYFSVIACGGNGQCSAWSTEAVHVVVASNTAPGAIPESPTAVLLIVQNQS